ncbi:MAG: GH116 family glycosyl hydrolase [Balneolaceae bacterium]|jgi:glycogen debranching enzyme
MSVLITTILCLLTILAPSKSQPKIRVGVITNPELHYTVDTDSLFHILSKNDDFRIDTLNIRQLFGEDTSLEDYDLLWYHRQDSAAISEVEHRAGSIIKHYITKGGKLILSMDAVRLLNDWNIEPSKIQSRSDKIRDEGFGRKLGFHAYRTHPLFRNLYGGAYIWHAKKDHTVRKLGFFQDRQPRAPASKVIGIEWAYITFKEQNKLLWQTSLGKGSVLAIGAYTYFSRPNFNKEILSTFTENCVRYLVGEYDNQPAYYWNYKPIKVASSKIDIRDVTIYPAKKWTVPASSLSINSDSKGNNSWDVPGRRMLVMGREKGGIEEIWTHPVMSLRDYQPGIRHKNGHVTWLNTLSPVVTSRPDALIREYKFDGAILREIITTSIDKPVAEVHYEWEGAKGLELIIKFKSNLRMMWPYSARAMGSLIYQWTDKINGFIVTDQRTKDFNTVLSFNQKPFKRMAGTFNDFNITKRGILIGKPTDKKQVAAIALFKLEETGQMDVLISSGAQGINRTINFLQEAGQDPHEILIRGHHHYENLLNNSLTINSPDSTFNEGYRWALVGTDQFIARTPGVGTSLMAGYATTAHGWDGSQRVSGRPGYAWYFGRDAAWSSFALDDYGNTRTVREVLANFARYQQVNGKIYHELTSSGSVHYDAADATPLYIILAGHYLRHSGDLTFITDQWPAIQKAIEYCYRTDTDGDGLIENTNVGHGWIEGGKLFGAHTTFYLAGLWAKALEEAAYIAKLVKRPMLSAKYLNDSHKVKDRLNTGYWNQKSDFFNYGKFADGTYDTTKTVLPAVPIYFGVVDTKKVAKVMPLYNSDKFSSDWGVRILGNDSPLYQPAGYHYGSVWPLFTGWTSLAEYKSGRAVQGFSHVMNNLLIYKKWASGNVEEVMNGELYKPSGVSAHQCWSETMVLQPILEGMLMLKPDAVNHHLSLSPFFPWDWERVGVNNIRVGSNHINFEMIMSTEAIKYHFDNNGEESLRVDFNPHLPLGSSVRKVTLNDRKVDYNVKRTGESVLLDIPEFKIDDKTLIKVVIGKGVGVLPKYRIPKVGSESSGIKVINEEFDGSKYLLTIEGKSSRDYILELYSGMNIKSIKQGEIIERKGHKYIISVGFKDQTKVTSTKTITINF